MRRKGRRRNRIKVRKHINSLYSEPSGSNELFIENGLIYTNIKALIKSFHFRLVSGKIIRSCAGFRLIRARDGIILQRKIICNYSNPIAIYDGDIKIRTAFAVDIKGRIIYFFINKDTHKMHTLSTAVSDMNDIKVGSLSNIQKVKIDRSSRKDRAKSKHSKTNPFGRSQLTGGDDPGYDPGGGGGGA